jgi:hypothetical protein
VFLLLISQGGFVSAQLILGGLTGAIRETKQASERNGEIRGLYCRLEGALFALAGVLEKCPPDDSLREEAEEVADLLSTPWAKMYLNTETRDWVFSALAHLTTGQPAG